MRHFNIKKFPRLEKTKNSVAKHFLLNLIEIELCSLFKDQR